MTAKTHNAIAWLGCRDSNPNLLIQSQCVRHLAGQLDRDWLTGFPPSFIRLGGNDAERHPSSSHQSPLLSIEQNTNTPPQLDGNAMRHTDSRLFHGVSKSQAMVGSMEGYDDGLV